MEPAAKEVGIVGPFWLPYIPAHVCDAPQKQRRGREGCARAHAAREHLGHVEHLRASDHAIEARGAEPGSEPVARQKQGKTSTEAYRTLTDVQNSVGDLQVIDKVGVPGAI